MTIRCVLAFFDPKLQFSAPPALREQSKRESKSAQATFVPETTLEKAEKNRPSYSGMTRPDADEGMLEERRMARSSK